MPIGLGIGLNISMRGGLASGFSLDAPVLAFVSATDPSNDATQDFTIDIADPGALEGDEIVVVAKIGTDFSGSSPSEYDVIDTYTVLASDVGGGGDFTGEITLTLTPGVAYCRAFHKRGGTYSAPSTTISKTVDVTAPTLSNATDTESGETTADVAVDTNEANGILYCVVTTSATSPTAAQVKLGQDNSAASATFADDQAIVSTGTKTFNVTGLTAATAYTAHFMHEDAVGNQSTVVKGNGFTTDASSFSPADLTPALWLDASDLSTLFQDVAGSSAVTTDAQTVGTWNDKSGDNFHLTAVADDTTRPTYNTSGGLHWVTFNGTNNALRRLASLGLYSGGAFSVFVAVKGNPAINMTLLGEGNSATDNPFMSILRAYSGPATTLCEFFRNDAGSAVSINQILAANAFNNTDRVVGITDDGSGALAAYVDSATAVDTGSYTRGTITLNRFSLGATLRTTMAGFFAGRVYGVVITHSVLDATQRANLITWLGAKAGLTL